MTSPQVENKAKSKTSGLEAAKVKTSGDDVKEVAEEKSSETLDSEDGDEENSPVKGKEEQDEKVKKMMMRMLGLMMKRGRRRKKSSLRTLANQTL